MAYLLSSNVTTITPNPQALRAPWATAHTDDPEPHSHCDAAQK